MACLHKFKWRQFEYHSAIQSLKHVIWESWMMQYDHIYAAICIMIKLKVMFWKLYTRIYFNVGTFKYFYFTVPYAPLAKFCLLQSILCVTYDLTTPFLMTTYVLTVSYPRALLWIRRRGVITYCGHLICTNTYLKFAKNWPNSSQRLQRDKSAAHFLVQRTSSCEYNVAFSTTMVQPNP